MSGSLPRTAKPCSIRRQPSTPNWTAISRREPTRAELQYPVAVQRVTHQPRVIHLLRGTGSAGGRTPPNRVLSMQASLHYRALIDILPEPYPQERHFLPGSSAGVSLPKNR